MIYIVQLGHLPYVKVGFSKKTKKRISDLQGGVPLSLRKISTMRGTLELEQKWHKALTPWRIRGEWYVADTAFVDKLSRICNRKIRIAVSSDALDLEALAQHREADVEARQVAMRLRSMAKLQRSATRMKTEIESLRRLKKQYDKISEDNEKLTAYIASLELRLHDLVDRMRNTKPPGMGYRPSVDKDGDDLADEIRRTMAEAEQAVAAMENSDDLADEIRRTMAEAEQAVAAAEDEDADAEEEHRVA